MFKKIKKLFISKKKKYYNPNGTSRKISLKEVNSNRKESYKTLNSSGMEERESIKDHVSSDICNKECEGKENSSENLIKELQMDDFYFVSPIPEDRYNEVIAHLRNNFFEDEPLNKSIGLSQPGAPHAELEAYALNTLQDQLSVMAVEKDTDKVVAVALNGIQHSGDIQRVKNKLEKMTDDKLKKILTLLYDINEKLDLFSKYRVEKLCDARILSIDSNYRGKGLAKEVTIRSEAVAKENGFKVIKADATGMFSQKILESLGCKVIYELKYADHRNEQNEPIFKPAPPNESLKIMVKQL